MIKKILLDQDQDNKHYQIDGAKNIYYAHHLGKNRNPEWERVTIVVVDKEDPENTEPYSCQFDGVGCAERADKKLKELMEASSRSK